MQEIGIQKSLPELVYDAVVNAICEGTLRAGDRLTQADVAERLGVSRLPVGQALQRLKTEGFVVEAGRRGLQVAPLSAELIRDLYGLRAGLDMIAAGEAARRIDSKGRRRGQALLTEGEAAVAAGDRLMLIEADWEFHAFIYELAGNKRLMEVMSTQWQQVRRVMIKVIDAVGNPRCIWQEHAAIFAAVADGDVERAESLARRHVTQASALLQDATVRLRSGNE
jgi:DNA-binding GntR family transcriptional regulator